MKTYQAKLACWMCTLLAAFFCLSFAAPAAFADELADMQAKAVVLEQEVAKLNAQIAAVDRNIGEAKNVMAQTEVQPEAIIVGLFTVATPAEGWRAWQRQTATYKRAHPWEGEQGVWCQNSKRLGISCDPKVMDAAWRKMPTGTMFYLPAPEMFVYVPQGAKAPEALALVPVRDDPNLLRVMPPSVPVVTKAEKMATAVAEQNAAALEEKTAALAKAEKSLNKWKAGFGLLVALLLIFAIRLLVLKTDIAVLRGVKEKTASSNEESSMSGARTLGSPLEPATEWPFRSGDWEEGVRQNDGVTNITLTPDGKSALTAGNVTIPPASASEKPEASGKDAHDCDGNCGHDHKH